MQNSVHCICLVLTYILNLLLKGEKTLNKVLEVKGLSKQYDKVLAANNVNFDIDSGEIFAQ